MDRFSPVAPAYIRVLLLPLGQIERQRFLDFLSRLQSEACTIRLTDVQRYTGNDDDELLSPKAFPQGSILYNYSTSAPSRTQEQLSPFEIWRQPLLVLGVVDGSGRHDGGTSTKGLEEAAEHLRELHPRVVHRHILILKDGEDAAEEVSAANTTQVNHLDNLSEYSLKDAMSELSARFLKELRTYCRAMEASPSVQTPGQTARSLQRTSSQREREKRPASGHGTPPRGPSTPVDRGSPATSFEQITSANNISRSDSRTSSKSKHVRRASSQDRVSVQGFGSGASSDKLKQRGKARVGIIIGSIHMAAGQWSEALRILIEHTNKARALQDHIWHAKGLENIIVCLLLHSWVGLEFQIPSICYPIADKSSTSQRSSVNVQSEPGSSDAPHFASVRRLSTSLPVLLKLILSLYRSVEGSLELPFVCIAEATIRFGKLLAISHNAAGELNPSTLDPFITGNVKIDDGAPQTVPKSHSKVEIANMLANAQPNNDEMVQVADQVAMLAGTATVYGLIHMHRKRATVLKDLVMKLTTALTQARKRGAAEAGIHPAASLSAETGADAIVAITEDSDGIHKIMGEIAGSFGIEFPKTHLEDPNPSTISQTFGNDSLKLRVLRALGGFCEAVPDPNGVLLMTTSVLSVFGPNGTVDPLSDRRDAMLSKDDQTRLTTTISRTIGVSQHLGIPNVEGVYWDRFLVRGVEFSPQYPGRALIDKSTMAGHGAVLAGSMGAGTNPLLYDPNASRPGTAPETPTTYLHVAGERSTCTVTLQNPSQVLIEIEWMHLEVEGVELRDSCGLQTLQPLKLQKFSWTFHGRGNGEASVKGVRIKIAGCKEDVFPIVKNARPRVSSGLIKDIGQDILNRDTAIHDQEAIVEKVIVPIMVVIAQPTLVLRSNSLHQSSVMLLDGETQEFEVEICNDSHDPLNLFDMSTGHGSLRMLTFSTPYKNHATDFKDACDFSEGVQMPPSECCMLKFAIEGEPAISRLRIDLFYSRVDEPTTYARKLSIPIDVTANAALRAQNLRVLPVPDDPTGSVCLVCFELRNVWLQPLKYSFHTSEHEDNESIAGSPTLRQQGLVHPGKIEPLNAEMSRLSLPSGSKAAVDEVRASLREVLRVDWSADDGRAGRVDLSKLALRDEDVEATRRPSVGLECQLMSSHTPDSELVPLGKATVKLGSFVALAVTVTWPPDRGDALLVLLRVHAADRGEGERGVVVVGNSYALIRPVAGVGREVVVFHLGGILAGRYEVEAVVKGMRTRTETMARRVVPLKVV